MEIFGGLAGFALVLLALGFLINGGITITIKNK
jgi:hypothetical protein